MDREAFLSRVGRASLTSHLPDAPRVPSSLPELPPTGLLALFRARAQSVNAVVHGPMSRHGAPQGTAENIEAVKGRILGVVVAVLRKL